MEENKPMKFKLVFRDFESEAKALVDAGGGNIECFELLHAVNKELAKREITDAYSYHMFKGKEVTFDQESMKRVVSHDIWVFPTKEMEDEAS